MRRSAVLTVLFLLVLAMISGTALAAGKLTVKSETFIVLPYLDYHAGYVYAEVENKGDKPVEYTGGLLELFDEEGNSIEAEEPYRCYPEVLGPGETGYLYVGKSVEEATDKSFISDYLLTVTGKGAKGKTVTRYPATARYEENKSGYWTNYYEIASVTNDTKDVCYDFTAVFAARDAEGNLLHVQACDPSYVGIMPGSSIEIRTGIDSSIIEYYGEKGTPIASVDVIVFTTNED